MNPVKQEMKPLLYHLPRIWNVEERVVGADLGLGRFQFDFQEEEDIVEVLKREPFHFDNWMLSIVRWEPVVEDNYPSKIIFFIFWAQPTFKSIGEALGVVRGDDAIEINEGKIQVTLDAFKPLVFSITVEFHSGEETVVALRYERLHGFCRTCSRLTHDQSKCPITKGVKEEDDVGPSDKPDQGGKALSYKQWSPKPWRLTLVGMLGDITNRYLESKMSKEKALHMREENKLLVLNWVQGEGIGIKGDQ